MKKGMNYLGILFAMLFLVNCEKLDEETQKVDLTAASNLSGTWKLVKISYGYPIPNMPSFTTKVDDVTYQFDENAHSYTYLKNGATPEQGKFTTETTKMEFYDQNVLTFVEKNEYTTYMFDTETKQLILYERMPIGAMMADGNSYHFEKVK